MLSVVQSAQYSLEYYNNLFQEQRELLWRRAYPAGPGPAATIEFLVGVCSHKQL